MLTDQIEFTATDRKWRVLLDIENVEQEREIDTWAKLDKQAQSDIEERAKISSAIENPSVYHGSDAGRKRLVHKTIMDILEEGKT